MDARRLELVLEKRHETIYIGDVMRRDMLVSSAVIRRIKWLPDGILVQGEKVHTRHFGKEGDLLSVLIGEQVRRSEILSVYGDLDIVYEDQDFLLLNKAAGVVVHPTPSHMTDTLGNFILHYYDRCGFGGDFHPVHRLDRGTSGLVVVAKHPYAQERFTQQLHSSDFRREYLALCWGKLPQERGSIHAPILTDDTMVRKVHSEGLPAVSHYVLEGEGQYQGRQLSLVSLSLETGRTHQIRVHLSHLGNPLLGDELYGQGDVLSHTALHAFRLSLRHPVSKEALVFTAKPPEDFCQVLEEAGLSLPCYFQ